MKKKNKMMRFLSFVMVCIMTVAMMAVNVPAADENGEKPASPAPTGTLTLQNTVEGDIEGFAYNIYKIFDSVPAGTNVYEYSWTEAFVDINNKAEYGSLTVDSIQKMKNGLDNYEMGGNDTVDAITQYLVRYINDNKATVTPVNGDERVGIGETIELPYGYYLILETETPADYKTSKPMLVEISGADGKKNVTLNVKNQKLAIEKKILDEENLKDAIAEQVGKPITFQVTYDVPQYDPDLDVVFKIRDTMSKGLTFSGADTVKVYNGVADEKNLLVVDENYQFTPEEGIEDNEGKTILTFDFSNSVNGARKDYYKKLIDKGVNTLVIQYQAKLNEEATFGPGENSDTNVNTVVPIYGREPGTETEGKPDKTKSYSGAIEIVKKDAKDTTKLLPGATFTVYSDEECKNEVPVVVYDKDGNPKAELSATAITDANGRVRFAGLGAGTYYIKETDSPSGYILLKNPIKLIVEITPPKEISTGKEDATFTYTVSGNGIVGEVGKDEITSTANDGFFEFDVENQPGVSLPTTGGMGTYLFTIGGVILIGAAAILLVRSRKKS